MQLRFFDEPELFEEDMKNLWCDAIGGKYWVLDIRVLSLQDGYKMFLLKAVDGPKNDSGVMVWVDYNDNTLAMKGHDESFLQDRSFITDSFNECYLRDLLTSYCVFLQTQTDQPLLRIKTNHGLITKDLVEHVSYFLKKNFDKNCIVVFSWIDWKVYFTIDKKYVFNLMSCEELILDNPDGWKISTNDLDTWLIGVIETINLRERLKLKTREYYLDIPKSGDNKSGMVLPIVKYIREQLAGVKSVIEISSKFLPSEEWIIEIDMRNSKTYTFLMRHELGYNPNHTSLSVYILDQFIQRFKDFICRTET